jgi:uncharacterized protein (UPF0332 family)
MDIPTKRAVIRIRLDRAREDLDTAHDLLKASRWRGAVNRAYYTVFHAASAALLWLDIERAKHSGIQAAFSEYLVKPGLIEVEYGRTYRRVREWREEQDYDIAAKQLDESAATQIVNDAEHFLDRIERYLRQERAIDAP